MTREDKIEAIRTVYGDKAVEGCEDWGEWELVPVNAPDEEREKCKEYWNGCQWVRGKAQDYTSSGRLGRYPREIPKPKCIVADVPVEWIKGEMVVNNRTVLPFIGNDDICHAGRDDWQIAGFLFENPFGDWDVPIINHDGECIRANRVGLVRWE